jgi:hypothetical protein
MSGGGLKFVRMDIEGHPSSSAFGVILKKRQSQFSNSKSLQTVLGHCFVHTLTFLLQPHLRCVEICS